VRAAVVQSQPDFGRIEQNLSGLEALLARELADLYVLPELCASGYLFNHAAELERLGERSGNGPVFELFSSVAKKRDCYITGGFVELSDAGPFNASMLVGPEGLISVYRKVHLFDQEKRWFAPGPSPFRVETTPVGRLGLMICFDWIFPESMRSLALGGAQLICHQANLVLPFCQEAMITRAIENRVYILTANRIGEDRRSKERHLSFTGRSQIVAPGGVRLGQLASDEEGVLVVDIDPCLADEKAINANNDLFNDRKPKCYDLDSPAHSAP